jgi:hypothetical protein
VKSLKLTPYEKIIDRYYGGLDVSLGWHHADSIDTYIISYPKSGRTWLKIVLQLLLIKQYGAVRFMGNMFFADDSPRIFAAHTGYYYTPKKTIFLLRDPRDALVSFYHHVQTRGPGTMHKYKNMNISDFVRDKDLGIVPLVNYYRRWWKRLKKCKELMVVRYEDMVTRDVEIFNDIHNFLGLDVPVGKFLETIKFCRFENLKKEIAKPDGVFANHPDLFELKPTTPNPNSAKLRRGVIGGYVDELTKEDIGFINKKMKKMPRAWRVYDG